MWRTMQQLDPLSLPVLGALDCQQTPEGVVFRRSPAWAKLQIVDPALDLIVAMPAGVRLEFRTTSTSLELDAVLTMVQIEGFDPTNAVFDVVVGDQSPASVAAASSARIFVGRDKTWQVHPGPPTTVKLNGLPADGETPVEVWLPHAAMVEVRDARIDAGATLLPIERQRRRWVHHGSSISHCVEAPSPTQTWPALVARTAGVDLVNLGFAGQCVLDGHVARTIRDLDVDLISVKAGINIVNGDVMRERAFVPALHAFLDTIRDRHRLTPLVLVTPIICPCVEENPGPTVAGEGNRYRALPRPPDLATGALTLQRIRQLIADVVDVRRMAGDTQLYLVDGLQLFGPDDVADLPDALHPNPAGYRRIAERFSAQVFAPDGPFARS